MPSFRIAPRRPLAILEAYFSRPRRSASAAARRRVPPTAPPPPARTGSAGCRRVVLAIAVDGDDHVAQPPSERPNAPPRSGRGRIVAHVAHRLARGPHRREQRGRAVGRAVVHNHHLVRARQEPPGSPRSGWRGCRLRPWRGSRRKRARRRAGKRQRTSSRVPFGRAAEGGVSASARAMQGKSG